MHHFVLAISVLYTHNSFSNHFPLRSILKCYKVQVTFNVNCVVSIVRGYVVVIKHMGLCTVPKYMKSRLQLNDSCAIQNHCGIERSLMTLHVFVRFRTITDALVVMTLCLNCLKPSKSVFTRIISLCVSSTHTIQGLCSLSLCGESHNAYCRLS